MPVIVVASQNPVKIRAALAGFQRMMTDESFEARGVSVPSGVSDQPLTSDETLRGAVNRARAAQSTSPDVDYWVGIEGGIEDTPTNSGTNGIEMQVFAWVVVISATDEKLGKGRTGTFIVPEEVATLVRQGDELGDADDKVFGRSNSKQDNGSVGILTDNVIDRAAFYEQAVMLALIPFKNPQLTF
ncbi:MAG: inosine/xanthosine triphosphatase [Burkholderiales bacterium]|nr:inosine/xanthosine triphosphatase [Anaerolineae bacterium]